VVLAWLADFASAVYLGGTMIQGLIVLNNPGYEPQRWQGTLLLYAVAIFSALFNTVLARWLPFVEGSILIIHIVGFFVVLVALTYLGPHASAEDVFANFLTLGGYDAGLSFFVGLITTVFAFIGEFVEDQAHEQRITDLPQVPMEQFTWLRKSSTPRKPSPKA